jgi:hypothetical protein
MLDGFQVRFRGPGWGKKKTQETRVEWHEEKTGVFYVQEQAVRQERGQLLEKVVVSWQGEPMELGRRLHWEALRGGLARAHEVLTVADGASWIWNVVRDRWAGAHQLLDFYHASQHLWALAQALHGQFGDEPFGSVVAEHGYDVAPTNPQSGQAVGEVAHPLRVLRLAPFHKSVECLLVHEVRRRGGAHRLADHAPHHLVLLPPEELPARVAVQLLGRGPARLRGELVELPQASIL